MLRSRREREGTVETLRSRALERSNTVPQCLVIVCLDDQVEVVVFDADVDDAKVAPLDERVHRPTDRVVRVRPPERRDRRDYTQRHVSRCRALEPHSRLVRLARPRPPRRPTGPPAFPTPGLEF